MIFVDTNVLFDIVTDDPVWYDWSAARLAEAELVGPLIVDSVVYAEFSVGYPNVEETDVAIAGLAVSVVATPSSALFLAEKAFQRYRASGGLRTGVLPDFFIGAHAAVSGLPLLTRDPRRYRTYFPTLELIAPETTN